MWFSGVTTISLYDYYGRLRSKKIDIDNELREYYSDFTKDCKNSPKKQLTPKIQFVSVENGRTDLVYAGLLLTKIDSVSVLKLPRDEVMWSTQTEYLSITKELIM